MRPLIPFAVTIAFSVVVFSPGEAAVQSWTKHVSRDLHFTINFPETPQIEHATYASAEGHAIPAQIFSAEEGTALYKLTVVDFSGHRTLESGAAAHAAEVLMRRGVGYHNRYAYMDGLAGHHLSLTEPNGRRLQATIYFFDHRLYIVEGSDILETPLPSSLSDLTRTLR